MMRTHSILHHTGTVWLKKQVYATNLTLRSFHASPFAALILDVAVLSLGLETQGGVFTRLIDRNTIIPTKKTLTFSTAVDFQTKVQIKVLQGERGMAADNKLLGEFDLVGIPPAPRGVPQIEVSFDMVADGILHVSARDKATNKEQRIAIESSDGLSRDYVQKMVRDGEVNQAADAKRCEGVQARNELNYIIHSVSKRFRELGENIDSSVESEIQATLDAAKQLDSNADVEKVKEHVQALSNISVKIGQAMYSSGKQEGGGKCLP